MFFEANSPDVNSLQVIFKFFIIFDDVSFLNQDWESFFRSLGRTL